MICKLMIWWLRETSLEVEKIDSDSIEPFEKGRSKLHKWHPSEPNLEINDLSSQK